VGHALLNLQRLDEAESAYQKGLEIAPEDKGLKDGLARVAQVKAGGAGAGMGV
jgi:cytochrome c-type biogenesis protein CcmH/NrfG